MKKSEIIEYVCQGNDIYLYRGRGGNRDTAFVGNKRIRIDYACAVIDQLRMYCEKSSADTYRYISYRGPAK